jgi:ABC-type amino acid transport substrate-binding protein
VKTWIKTQICSALAGLLSVMALLPANAQDLELTEAERAWIEEHPVIRVHNEMNWPPFNFNQNGEPRGYSIDFMNLVASRTGLQVEYISGPSWQQFLDMTQSNELDVMLNINATPERAEYLNFTDYHLQSPAAIVVKDLTLSVTSLQDLYGKRVAVPDGFFTEEFLAREHAEIELVLESDTLGSLYAVLEGRADAMLDDFPVTDYLINQHTLTSLRVAMMTRDPGLASAHSLGIRKDWPVLRDILQKGMDAVDQTEITELRQKWFGAEFADTSTERNIALTAEERTWISEHPVIRVHNEMNWPPFNFNENGEPRGFSIDLMNLVASRARIQVGSRG